MKQERIKIDISDRDKLKNALSHISKETAIIVDFDETLLLRNSTAEYLDNLKPRLLGALLLKIMSYLRPWQWLVKSSGQKKSRDWFLVFVTTLLMPWNLFIWWRKAPKLAEKYSNYDLLDDLSQSPSREIIVASLGFNFIIQPILKFIPIQTKQLIGCRFWQGLQDRQKGKLAMLRDKISQTKIASSVVITDSLNDLPLLERVEQPYLIVWEKSQYNIPMKDLQFLSKYLQKIEQIGRKIITKF